MERIADTLRAGGNLYHVAVYSKALGTYRFIVSTPDLEEARRIAAEESASIIEVSAKVISASVGVH